MVFAARSEQAIREELVALALSVPAAWLIGVTMMRRVELVCAVALVLVVELLNTAIEKLADRLTMDRDPQIGRVKDMGSAAVGVALLMAGIVGPGGQAIGTDTDGEILALARKDVEEAEHPGRDKTLLQIRGEQTLEVISNGKHKPGSSAEFRSRLAAENCERIGAGR